MSIDSTTRHTAVETPDAASNGHYLEGEHTYATLDTVISSIVFKNSKHPRAWYIVCGLGFLFLNVMMISLVWLLYKGVGVWGINIPVGWGFDIINFVWWIGIGHAGTLISAILLLLRQRWRNSINRFAEAMTLFAVMCAGLFPLFHTGRPWVAFYWLPPVGPNILGLWPQFRSPLIWDVFAVSTYLTVSVLFWFMGLIPDLAIMRDRAKNPGLKILFGMLAMGWRGASKHWHRYETAYLILAGLSTPLVLSVHSIISLDFAVSIIPGWHTTIFPPYFVAGAVFAGFAMVLLLAIPVRNWYHLKDLITDKHLDWCAKIMLVTGLVVFYGYMTEVFYGWYAGGREWEMIHNRATGPYGWVYWLLILCNGVLPQTMWVGKWRRKELVLMLVALEVSVGMWLERFVIIVSSLEHAEQPPMRQLFIPTIWDWGLYLGTIGMFTFFMFLFIRFVPMINIFEMKDLLHKQRHDDAHNGAHNGHAETASQPAPATALND